METGLKYLGPNTHTAKGKTGPRDKPCPTCYAPMKWVGDHWECVKHGIPTRD